MMMALSTCSRPLISLCFPGSFSLLWRYLWRDGARIPEIREDLPDPETPVTEVKQPSGSLTSILLKLLC